MPSYASKNKLHFVFERGGLNRKQLELLNCWDYFVKNYSETANGSAVAYSGYTRRLSHLRGLIHFYRKQKPIILTSIQIGALLTNTIEKVILVPTRDGSKLTGSFSLTLYRRRRCDTCLYARTHATKVCTLQHLLRSGNLAVVMA